jgi:2-methylcitrate dehydratase PrpD
VAATSTDTGPELRSRYAVAFTDWLACACGGRDQRAARAVRSCGDDLLTSVAFAATAGHVLDFDDTFEAGIAHVSATCAPAALMLASRLGRSLEAMLDAYAAGFEAMGAVAAASHPALYDAGWHPTAVCGPIGAAVAAAQLLGLSPAQTGNALALAVLRAGGTRGAFGSDGKAIQVGQAAAAGVQAALLAQAGASVDRRAIDGPLGFTSVVGATWPLGDQAPPCGGAATADAPAIQGNWIKLHPSCLGTHAPIEAAAEARRDGYRADGEPIEVRVHPVARQAAHLDAVTDGLSAKFSIPYCVARTLRSGPPRVADFTGLEEEARRGAAAVTVVVDERLESFGAVVSAGGVELAQVSCPRGAPERPVSAADLADKVTQLAGDRLTGILAEPAAPAAVAVDAAGLRI